MPEKVSVKDRAMATAGLANDVEAVNQYAAVMYNPTAKNNPNETKGRDDFGKPLVRAGAHSLRHLKEIKREHGVRDHRAEHTSDDLRYYVKHSI